MDQTAVPSPDSASGKQPRSRGRLKLVFGVVFVLGSCAGALYPAVQSAREAARRTSCNCQLKQIGLALHNYHDAFGSFPPAFVRGPDGRPWHSWRVLILPYVDESEIYKQYEFSEPWDGPTNIQLLKRRPAIYDCPSREESSKRLSAALPAIGLFACSTYSVRSGASTSYAAVFGPDCAFRGSDPVNLQGISDGSAMTALVGELTAADIPWTKPEDIDIRSHSHVGDPLGFSSNDRQSRVFFLLADGAVVKVSPSMPQKAIDALFTRDAGDDVPANTIR